MKETWSKIEIKYKICFFSALIIGLFTHAYIFYNKISFHDDVMLIGAGSTFSSGRWMLGIVHAIIKKVIGSESIPAFIGPISLILLGMTGVLLVKIYEIESSKICALIGALLVVFPSIAGLYGYMFTSWYYCFGILLAVLAVFLCNKINNLFWGIGISAFVIACSVGIYQAYISITVSSFILLFILQIYNTENDIVMLIKKAISYATTIIIGLLEYLIINKVFLALLHISMTDYKNLNNMGKISLKTLCTGIKEAYIHFIGGGQNPSLYIGNIKYIYYGVIIFCVCMIVSKLINWIQNKEYIRSCIWGLTCIMLPLAINFLYLMNVSEMYSLMQYSEIFVFIFVLVLVDRIKDHIETHKRVVKSVLCLVIVSVAYTIIVYAKYDNLCYLNAQISCRKVDSWMTALVANIKECEGYNSEMQIMYVNEGEVKDITFDAYSPLYMEHIVPYSFVDLRNEYNWKDYLRVYCGFTMNEVDSNTRNSLINSEEVVNMCSYPNDGSIRIINGIIVVKF